jgi:hypothetical protein
LQKQLDELEQQKADTLAAFAVGKGLSTSAAEQEIRKQREEDRRRGRVHWSDRFDQRIAGLRSEIEKHRAEASKRVRAATEKSVDDAIAKERAHRARLEKIVAGDRPGQAGFVQLVKRWGADRGMPNEPYQQLLVKAIAEDPMIRDLYQATRNAPPSDEQNAAAAELLALDKRDEPAAPVAEKRLASINKALDNGKSRSTATSR